MGQQQEVSDSAAASEQQQPLLAAGGQQKVRLLACCACLLLLQWQGSTGWGADGGVALRWPYGHPGRAMTGSRKLLWEQEPLGSFWKNGQLPDWARSAPLSVYSTARTGLAFLHVTGDLTSHQQALSCQSKR